MVSVEFGFYFGVVWTACLAPGFFLGFGFVGGCDWLWLRERCFGSVAVVVAIGVVWI